MPQDFEIEGQVHNPAQVKSTDEDPSSPLDLTAHHLELKEAHKQDVATCLETNAMLRHIEALKAMPWVHQLHEFILDPLPSYGPQDGPAESVQPPTGLSPTLLKLGLSALLMLAGLPFLFMTALFYVSWFLVQYGVSKLVVDTKESFEVYLGEEMQRFIGFFQSDALQTKILHVKKSIHDKANGFAIVEIPPSISSYLSSFETTIAYPIAIVLAFRDGTAAFPRKRKHEDPSSGMTLFVLDEAAEARKRRRKAAKSNTNSSTGPSSNTDRNPETNPEEDGRDLQAVVDNLQVPEAICTEEQEGAEDKTLSVLEDTEPEEIQLKKPSEKQAEIKLATETAEPESVLPGPTEVNRILEQLEDTDTIVLGAEKSVPHSTPKKKKNNSKKKSVKKESSPLKMVDSIKSSTTSPA